MSSQSRIDWGLGLAALALAALGAGAPFTSDEVWSIRTVSLGYAEMMDTLRGDVHPPLFYHLLRAWTILFGQSEWAVRGLTGLLYLLGVLAFRGLARETLPSGARILAGAVYLASPLALLAAHFGRMYSLLALLSVLSIHRFLRLHRDDARPVDWLSWAAVNALGTLTHVWYFFLLFAQAVAIAVFLPARRWLRPGGALLLSLIPYSVIWLPTLLGQLSRSGETAAWLGPPSFGDLGSVALMYGGALWVVIPLAMPAIWRKVRAGAPPAETTGSRGGTTRIAAFLLAATLAVPFVISFVKPVFYSRFAIVALPLFVLLAADLLSRFLTPRASRHAALLVLLIMGGFEAARHLTPDECSSRWTARYLAEQASPGDAVVFTSLSRLATEHYLTPGGPGAAAWRTSFPAEIDEHPGYEGAVIRNPGALEAEADALMERIGGATASGAVHRVLLFHGYRPEADELLEPRLSERYEREDAACRTCSQARNYYYRISVYHTREEFSRDAASR